MMKKLELLTMKLIFCLSNILQKLKTNTEKRKKKEKKKDKQKKKEEDRKKGDEKKKEKERKKKKSQQKMVCIPYRKLIRIKKGKNERDWEWARKYYEP